MVDIAFHYIDNNDSLLMACQQLSASPYVALDTEFVRFNTYYPIQGLVQLSDGQTHYLVDPVTIDVWQPLITLLTNPNITKVLHACGEDLELFSHWLGVIPTPLFDTQVAASFANVGINMGLQSLVASLLDVQMDKEEQRSDWLQRPLTDAQQRYAVLDVVYLLACQQQLMSMLEQQDKWHWFKQDMQRLAIKNPPLAIEQIYIKVKGAWRLTGEKLKRLQILAAWREQQARTDNKPKGFILKDPQLIQIAEHQQISLAKLANIEGIHPATVRQYAETITVLINDKDQHHNNYPEPKPLLAPISKQEQTYFKHLKTVVTHVAHRHDLDAQLLARKAQLVDVYEDVRNGLAYRSHPAWSGWRSELLDPSMTQAFNEVSIRYASR